jgi:hypothetical protein
MEDITLFFTFFPKEIQKNQTFKHFNLYFYLFLCFVGDSVTLHFLGEVVMLVLSGTILHTVCRLLACEQIVNAIHHPTNSARRSQKHKVEQITKKNVET